MEGPFQLAHGVIDVVAGDPQPAVFLLRRIETTPEFAHYRGRLGRTRSGESLAQALTRFVGSAYRVFWFEHASSAGAAFQRECRLWHELDGPVGVLDAPCHPQPLGTDGPRCCPVCLSAPSAGAA